MEMTTTKIRILSALPIVGHPRDSKRITMLRQEGFSVEAVAFTRPYHNGRLPECSVDILGEIESGRYMRRLLRMILVLPNVRRAIRRNSVVYASGVDMAVLSIVAGLGLGRPTILEVGDIREIQLMPGLFGRVIRWLDRKVTNYCSLLVVTAPKFLDVYYRQWLKSTVPALVIENKLEPDFVNVIQSEPMNCRNLSDFSDDRPIRIGYFGGLRCAWSWSVLRKLAATLPSKVEIILAGYPMNPPNLLDEVADQSNVRYLGEYQSPQDLPKLYRQVDLIWACYQKIGPNDWNLRWARPNRFYESCLFHKPLISRLGSSDAEEVDRLELGITVVGDSAREVVDKIDQITAEQIETWVDNFSRLPRSIYVYEGEAEDLRNRIEDIVKSSRSK